jgi:Flp pilus assembly protein CpaB
MEMEFKDTGRRRRLLLIGLGAALAIAAGYGAFQLAQSGSQAPAVVTESVLVAARDIPARTTLTVDDVALRDVPQDEVLPLTYRDANVVVGRVVSVPIYTNQQITPNLFATASANSNFSILDPDEQVTATSPLWRAVAIRIPNERAVGGEVEAGQHVDLIVSVDLKVLQQDANGAYGLAAAVRYVDQDHVPRPGRPPGCPGRHALCVQSRSAPGRADRAYLPRGTGFVHPRAAS